MFQRYSYSKIKDIISSTIFKNSNKNKIQDIYSELSMKNYMNYYDTIEFRNYLPNLKN